MIDSLKSHRARRLSEFLSGVCLIGIIFQSTPRAAEIPAYISQKLMSGLQAKDPEDAQVIQDSPDNSIDAKRYFVGGGDAFQISIVGLPSEEFFPLVNQSGDIYIGDFGLIKLGKITLEQAKELIRLQVKKKLKQDHEVYVTLKKVKKPVVTVTGAVLSSGTFQMSGTMRILDALKSANGGKLPFLDEVDYRHVVCRNGDSSATYDLMQFMVNQDLSQNPYLYPGDNILLEEVNERVYLKGEVMGPIQNRIPIKKGERFSDLMTLIKFKGSADSNYILVQQYDGDDRPMEPKQMSFVEAGKVELGDRDIITIGVKTNYRKTAIAEVSGEAVRPGTYPIQEERTTVADLLKLAGGPGAFGNLKLACLIKSKHSPITKDEASKTDRPFSFSTLQNSQSPQTAQQTQIDLATAAIRKVRPEINSSISDLNLNNDYTIVEIGDHPEAIELENGDRIYIPKRERFVYVSGAVRNAGAYPFKEGASFASYISAAGGYASHADGGNKFILASFDNLYKIKDASKVSEGDVLVVPTSVQYKTVSTIVIPMLQVTLGFLSVLITFMVLENQAK